MACASHLVQLENFGRTALPRLRQPFQVVPIRIGCHNHKMVKIDLSRGVDKGQEVSLNMLKLRTFCSAPDLLSPRNTREMAIRPGTVIVR